MTPHIGTEITCCQQLMAWETERTRWEHDTGSLGLGTMSFSCLSTPSGAPVLLDSSAHTTALLLHSTGQSKLRNQPSFKEWGSGSRLSMETKNFWPHLINHRIATDPSHPNFLTFCVSQGSPPELALICGGKLSPTSHPGQEYTCCF